MQSAEFELVYGDCSTILLASATSLCRLAIECGSDPSKFDTLLAAEQIPNAPTILKTLGDGYRKLLPHLVFENLPEERLRKELEFRSRYLSPGQPDQIVGFLYKWFSE
jgi:hypothetical protein